MSTSFTSQMSRIPILRQLSKEKTRAVVHPFVPKEISAEKTGHITVYDYDIHTCRYIQPRSIDDCFPYTETPSVTWINLDGLHPTQLETLANHFKLHWLILEDIMSTGQRPKVDEIEGVLVAQLNMLFTQATTGHIYKEQISIVLGKNFVLSFQEDAEKDVFDPIRKRLQKADSRERQKGADYLFYALIDIITDSYLTVIESIGQQIETVETQIIHRANRHTFENISQIRKDIILLKRNIAPVKDLVASLVRSESDLLEEKTAKYFKDVYDHVVQANDLIDNYRDLITGIQDLYVNNINLRMNEIMKTLAIITAIMAPATVIGGIFGMNFEVIPYSHHQWGFYVTIIIMIIIPVVMMVWFQRRGWFIKDFSLHKKEKEA